MSSLNAFWAKNKENIQSGAPMGVMGAQFMSSGARPMNAWDSGATYATTGGNIFSAGSQVANQIGGPTGVGIAGGLQMAGAAANLFGYNPEVDPIHNMYSQDQRPTFDLGRQRQGLQDFYGDFRRSANREVGRSAIGGAAAGTAIMPGIGTVIGGAVGALAGLFGRGSARRKAKAAQSEMQRELSSAMGRFQDAHVGASRRETSGDVFAAIQSSQNNIFGIPSMSSMY